MCEVEELAGERGQEDLFAWGSSISHVKAFYDNPVHHCSGLALHVSSYLALNPDYVNNILWMDIVMDWSFSERPVGVSYTPLSLLLRNLTPQKDSLC